MPDPMPNWPTLECKKLCQDYCGPVYPFACLEGEAERLEHAAAVLGIDVSQISSDLTCQFLSPEGLCRVYAQRPMICRIWGMVPELACPHGCRPSRWLTPGEIKALLGHDPALLRSAKTFLQPE